MGFLDKLKGVFGGGSPQSQDLNAPMPTQAPDGTDPGAAVAPGATPNTDQQPVAGAAPEANVPPTPEPTPQENDPTNLNQ